MMKLKEGDLFKIRLSDQNYVVGQIVSIPNKESIAIVVFKGLCDVGSPYEPINLTQKEILFFANTFDAKFHHRHWVIFANYSANLSNIRLPIYKLGTEQESRYEDPLFRMFRRASGTANNRRSLNGIHRTEAKYYIA
ncbi:MAG: Imm26 family immunity protein [Bacteroidota bacterium]